MLNVSGACNVLIFLSLKIKVITITERKGERFAFSLALAKRQLCS